MQLGSYVWPLFLNEKEVKQWSVQITCTSKYQSNVVDYVYIANGPDNVSLALDTISKLPHHP